MKRMTYMSNFSRPINDEEIPRSAPTRRRNAEDGITGVLLTLDWSSSRSLRATTRHRRSVRRVLADDRHTDVICLGAEPAAAPSVPRLVDERHRSRPSRGRRCGAAQAPARSDGRGPEIIEHYTQPAVSRIMTEGLNPLEVPLQGRSHCVVHRRGVFSAISERLPIEGCRLVAPTWRPARWGSPGTAVR